MISNYTLNVLRPHLQTSCDRSPKMEGLTIVSHLRMTIKVGKEKKVAAAYEKIFAKKTFFCSFLFSCIVPGPFKEIIVEAVTV